MIWLSDTQTMTYDNPKPLAAMGKWIASNIEEQNIRYVIQTGDIVENGYNSAHWKNFDRCYLEYCDLLPYFPIAGNHDIAVSRNDYTAYLERPFLQPFPPENLFEGGKAIYTTVHEGGLQLLLIGAGWDAEEAAVDWMNEIIQTYADHTAILLFHGYIKSNGGFTVVGKQMFDKVVVPNPNVRLVLCGHTSGYTGFRIDEIDDTGDGEPSRTVCAMMYNYQDIESAHAGQLRILKFDPLAHALTVTTYSPYTHEYYQYHDSYRQGPIFTIDDAF